MVDLDVLPLFGSLSLVAIAVGLSWWLRLGLTRSLLTAATRAAGQLLAVGLLFNLILNNDQSMALAWLWVLAMLLVTSVVAHRRAPALPKGGRIAALSVASTVAIGLTVVFGFGVLDYRPINVIVVAGITIGNALPSQVLGAGKVMTDARDRRGEIEALLSLGFTTAQVVRLTGGQIVRMAMVPQIERTNVVGLVALPGAMTGLLLAGADPIDAVLVQLVVMYLVLGAVSISVIVTVVTGMSQLFTVDHRLRNVE